MPKHTSKVDFNHNAWKTPVHFPHLSIDEVHVWHVNLLSEAEKQFDYYWNTLSIEEKERAHRFHFKKDRDQFVVAKGITRILLGKYILSAAKDIKFDFNSFGKPRLAGDYPIQFNISHAGGMGLFAFILHSPVGADIEKINPTIEVQKIAKRFFSSEETHKILNLPTAQQAKAFFTCWTRKEAFIKGHGEGLSLPLADFEVSILAEEPVAMLKIKWSPAEIHQWQLLKITVGNAYKAAVAIKGKVKKVRLFTY